MRDGIVIHQTFIIYALVGFSFATFMVIAIGGIIMWRNKGRSVDGKIYDATNTKTTNTFEKT